MVVSVRFLGGICLDDLSRNYLSSSLDLPLSLCYASYRKRWIKCRLFHFQKGLESLRPEIRFHAISLVKRRF